MAKARQEAVEGRFGESVYSLTSQDSSDILCFLCVRPDISTKNVMEMKLLGFNHVQELIEK